MPRFFFHVRNGATVATDLEGQDLADVEEAHRSALAVGRDFLMDGLGHGENRLGWTVEVRDAGDKTVFTVSMLELVE
jgi:hypothetical protein